MERSAKQEGEIRSSLEQAALLADSVLGVNVDTTRVMMDAKSLVEDLDPAVRTEARLSLEILQCNSISNEDYAVLGLLIEYGEMVDLLYRRDPSGRAPV